MQCHTANNNTQLMLSDIECLFELCPRLEVLTCGSVVDSGKVGSAGLLVSFGCEVDIT